jgi:hypothetical protein
VAESRSALEILRAPDDWSPPPSAVIALVGDEPFLAGELLRLIRGHLVPDEADRSWAWREFDGDSIEDPRDIFDEAATVPMFAGATRVAVVRSADPFVTKCRATLETLGAMEVRRVPCRAAMQCTCSAVQCSAVQCPGRLPCLPERTHLPHSPVPLIHTPPTHTLLHEGKDDPAGE